MTFLTEEVRKGITRRIYRAIDEKDARSFANLFNGYAYETMPDEWVVIL